MTHIVVLCQNGCPIGAYSSYRRAVEAAIKLANRQRWDPAPLIAAPVHPSDGRMLARLPKIDGGSPIFLHTYRFTVDG